MRDSLKVLFSGGNVEDHEGINIRKDGSSVRVLVRCRPLYWKGKKVFYVTFKDVTFLKDVQRQLEKKNQEIFEFTNAATHDLKKPLTTMKSVCSLMQTGALGSLNDDGKEAIGMGSEAISYMQELLDDLLASAQLDADVQQRALEEIDLRALALEVVGRLKYQIEEKKVTVSVDEELDTVLADRKGMRKVFMNLVGNAVNYIGEGPDRRIEIGAQSAEGKKIYYVRDNGIGIPEESQKTLFQKFKRGSNVKSISGTGTRIIYCQRNHRSPRRDDMGRKHDRRGDDLLFYAFIVFKILDFVGISLLGEKKLAVHGEVKFFTFAGDKRIERGLFARLFRPQNPSQPLGLFLARTERAGYLYRHIGIGQIDREIAHPRKNEDLDVAPAKALVEQVALVIGGGAGDDRRADFQGKMMELGEILADDKDLVVFVARKEFLRDGNLARVFVRQADLLAGRQRKAVQLSAGGRSTRISMQRAVAIHPWRSRSFQGMSNFLGPMRVKTSFSWPSSRMSVAVRPRRRRA